MSTVEQAEVLLHGHRVAYRTAGDFGADRPVLVLVHGMASSSVTWERVLPKLATYAAVLAPDLPGHGDSDKPRQDYSLGAHANTLRDLLAYLGIERATVVGQSLGGGIAMQFAYQHPQRCERLVLVASGGLGPEVSWLLRAMTLPGSEYLMPVLFPSFVRDAGNAVGRAVARLGVRWPHVEQGWLAYSSLVEPGNRQSFVRTLRSVVDTAGQAVTAQDRLYLAAGLPTLIVWGRRDQIIPVAHASAAHEAISGSRLVIFDEAGHFPHAEEPDAFADVLADFLETTEPVELDEAEWQAMLRTGPAARTEGGRSGARPSSRRAEG